MLDRAMSRLREEFDAQSKGAQFEVLKTFLTADRGEIPYAEAAGQLGVNEAAARVAVHRLRRRFRELFREEIALTVLDPFISVQPTSQSNCAGTTANFSVTATGTVTLKYQWYKGAAGLAGKTDSTLSLPTVSQTDAANYYVVVTNASTQSRTSSVVSLTVIDPPAITTGPSDRTVQSGVNVAFVVAATGTGPLSYQWSTNSVPIAGATGTSVIISNVAVGTYTVAVNVTNATFATVCGSVNASATLSVVSSLTLTRVCPQTIWSNRSAG